MVNRSSSKKLLSIAGLLKILGIVIAASVLGGCISEGNKTKTDAPLENMDENLSVQDELENDPGTSYPASNEIYWTIVTRELNTSGDLGAKLRIKNPEINESVLTVFKNEFGNKKAFRANITSISNNNWTRNFSLKLPKNASYFLVKVQVSKKNKVVKTVENNITLRAPVGEAT